MPYLAVQRRIELVPIRHIIRLATPREVEAGKA